MKLQTQKNELGIRKREYGYNKEACREHNLIGDPTGQEIAVVTLVLKFCLLHMYNGEMCKNVGKSVSRTQSYGHLNFIMLVAGVKIRSVAPPREEMPSNFEGLPGSSYVI